ncbi:hypothetical protein RR48_06896 [Papilio machaon]|uniref:Glycine N-acyltransferase-like protein n=1 Tax=Papilio machaon TaxID=76193 RepID=A0A194RAU0_PAPMA|nr:hypothetical protein RR48_06896 [Papilio machaon]
MNSLVAIPVAEWPRLRDLFSIDWPKGAAAYCLLDTSINCPKLSLEFNFKLYCPFGDMNNGMVAVTVQGDDIQVIIRPLRDVIKIEEALLSTNVIDWSKNIIAPFASPEVTASLVKISNKLNVKIYYEQNKAITFLLNKTCIPFDISLPENTYVESLKPEHIDIVDKTWTYSSERSKEYFEILMRNDSTYVLYSTENNEPMAWVTVNDAGSLSHLFCLEPYRRKGYGELITKYACNDILKKGRNIIAYTVENNYKSQKLLLKLGFENIGYDYWVIIVKK